MGSYLLVLNIPTNFHSCDLRNYFSELVECETHILCFHFRHRPQSQIVKCLGFQRTVLNQTLTSSDKKDQINKTLNLDKNPLCCVVKCSSEAAQAAFIKKYSLQNWIDKNDRTLPTCCVVVGVVIVEKSSEQLPISSLVIGKIKNEIQIPKENIESMLEMKPPLIMPKGNVGTPTKHFLELINSCRLPSSLVRKLGLQFPRTRTRKYGRVPFDYGYTEKSTQKPNISTSCFQNETLKNEDSSHKSEKEKASMPVDDDEEEWDRHESLHDDVTEQERTKERLYEEEMEVVWEKGGPGIVWYTDAQRWKEAEGDFDEQTSDDWDVDYSVYFEENGGDKDARDCLEMRQSTRWREGEIDSVFKKPKSHPVKLVKQNDRRSMKKDVVGPFEQHTRGIGRRLLEKHGWRDGIGLGKSQIGIAKPIESEGQKPKERKGLGYFGERLPRFRANSANTSKNTNRIATVFDRPSEVDPPESLLQRNQPTTMKYRVM